MAPAERREVFTGALERLTLLTQLADSKASPLLALQATLAAVTLASNHFRDLFDPDAHGSAAMALAGVLTMAYGLTAVIVSALVIMVYYPVVRRGHGSILFYEDVRHMPWQEYEQRASHISEAEVEEDMLRQVHTSSRIVSEKFHQLRWAYGLSAIGLAAWLAIMAWSSA